MSEVPLVERHRVLGLLMTAVVLLAFGAVTGLLLGELAARLLQAAIGVVSGGS